MVDVGRLAGVSHQTVSRVINRKGYVTESTRLKVESAMTTLGYRPNRVARGLALRRTHSIGVVNLGVPINVSLSLVQYAIGIAAGEADYTVMQTNVAVPKNARLADSAVSAAITQLLSQSVDGIILNSAYDMRLETVELLAAELPVVEIVSEPATGLSSVAVDGVLGGAMAARHLLELGHTRIAHVDGPTDQADALDRRRGFDRALQDAQLAVEVRLPGDWTSDSGYAAGRVLRKRRRVTAVFCSNDQMALGLLHAYADVGRFAPDSISVIGFDGLPEGAHYIPPLTTIRQDFLTEGRRAFEEVLHLIEGGARRRTLLPPELVVRSSTAPLASQ